MDRGKGDMFEVETEILWQQPYCYLGYINVNRKWQVQIEWKELNDGKKETCQRLMVEERACFAQKTFPEQSYSQSSNKVETVTWYCKEESIQDGTQENKEIPQVP